MPTHLVNLDALIVREDFEAVVDDPSRPGSKSDKLKLNELEKDSIVARLLRKPDFQRETASWKPKTVMEFVKSFLDGDLIPSVIFWQSPKTGHVFVIDGAHRLSALIAWVQDDYGNGRISQEFFEGFIPKEQKEAHEKTRELIKKHIGTYAEIRQAGLNPQNADPVSVRRAQNASLLSIDLQWVEGDASKAEASFFRINQQAAPIHSTELRVLQSRKKPNALATRALIHGKRHAEHLS
jgi:hypothetical protein